MNVRSILGFLCLTLPCWGSATIRECESITEVRQLATPQTLVVFDVDDTLLHAKQMLGSSVWFDESMKRQTTPEGIQQTIELWEAVQSVTDVEPMEPNTAEEVATLQKTGATVMAMTARGWNLWASTNRQFKTIGVDFTRAAPTLVLFSLQNIPSSSYGRGILFTCGGHKGRALKEFLRQTQLTPVRVIYINDKREPLEELIGTLPHTIEYIGLRYKPADALRDRYNPEMANAQLSGFANLMSDDQAMRLAKP